MRGHEHRCGALSLAKLDEQVIHLKLGLGLGLGSGSGLGLELESLTREARRNVIRHGFGLPAPRRASSMNCRSAMKRRLHACTSKVSTSAHARAAVAVACTASRAVARSVLHKHEQR